MMQQQARTVWVRMSRGFEHAADICLDVQRIETTDRVEAELAKEPRTMAQSSVHNDASCVVKSRPLPAPTNAGGPYTPEPFKPDDHQRMFPLDVASFSVPHGVSSRANRCAQPSARAQTSSPCQRAVLVPLFPATSFRQ